MLFESSFLLLAIVSRSSFGDSVTDGTELVMTLLTHRHGDRTPVEATLSFSSDPDALAELSAPYGYGQLTDAGKRRGYAVGKFIRARYNDLLSPQYNRSEIYIRSTDSTRTKMTVLSAMAAVYPANEDNWSGDINWTPVPYTTVPVKYDFNLAMLNCPKFKTGYTSLLMSNSSEMAQYSDILTKWSTVLGFDLTSYPVLAYVIYDVYTSQVSLGLPLGSEIEEIFDEIEEAAGGAIDVVFGSEDYIALQAGVLLNEFLGQVDLAIAGDDVKPVQVYSAHDYNVYSFMAVSQITPRQGVPKYGSVFALELRKVIETGNYVVLPVYLKSPDSDDVLHLQVDGCDDLLCDINQFKNITSNYVLEEAAWRTACEFYDDMVIDDSSIA